MKALAHTVVALDGSGIFCSPCFRLSTIVITARDWSPCPGTTAATTSVRLPRIYFCSNTQLLTCWGYTIELMQAHIGEFRILRVGRHRR